MLHYYTYRVNRPSLVCPKLFLSALFVHSRMRILLRTLDVLTHVLGQVQFMELLVIMEYHGEFIRLIQFYSAFLHG